MKIDIGGIFLALLLAIPIYVFVNAWRSDTTVIEDKQDYFSITRTINGFSCHTVITNDGNIFTDSEIGPKTKEELPKLIEGYRKYQVGDLSSVNAPDGIFILSYFAAPIITFFLGIATITYFAELNK